MPTIVVKKYTGTFYEQLAAYRADRYAVDVLFRRDCEAVPYPMPPKRRAVTDVPAHR